MENSWNFCGDSVESSWRKYGELVELFKGPDGEYHFIKKGESSCSSAKGQVSRPKRKKS